MKKYIREKDVAVAEDEKAMEEDVMERYAGELERALSSIAEEEKQFNFEHLPIINKIASMSDSKMDALLAVYMYGISVGKRLRK